MPTITKTKSRSRSSAKKSARRRITADDLLKFHIVSDPQISPDGNVIAFVKKHTHPEKNEYVTNLWIVDTSRKSKPRQFTNGGKDSSPRWSPDGSRLAFIAGRDKARPQIWIIPAEGGEATALTKFTRW
jgi:dipeptidyl aminopeptidase/acylaminoacyl peptidase